MLDLLCQPDAGIKLTVLPVEASTALDDARFFIQPCLARARRTCFAVNDQSCDERVVGVAREPLILMPR